MSSSKLSAKARSKLQKETTLNIGHDVINLNDIREQFNKDHLIHPYIRPEIKEEYQYALSEMPAGDGSYVGHQDLVDQLVKNISNPILSSSMLLGEQGSGKTATVEEMLYQYQKPDKRFQIIAIQLNLEQLGQLPLNKMVATLRNLLDTLKTIDTDTTEIYKYVANAKSHVMVLWADEIHKLNAYGNFGETSSLAMNALKETVGRSVAPMIVATTDYEYRKNLSQDSAFVRRFNTVVLPLPDRKLTKHILKKRMEYLRHPSAENQRLRDLMQLDGNIQASDEFLNELLELSDAYIRDQVNPAKSLSILGNAFTYAMWSNQDMDHNALKVAFDTAGYNVDSKANPRDIENLLNDNIIGQDLAVENVVNAINKSFYTIRNYNSPFMTMLFVGTTGVGKTETAKLLAEGFFGRRDAIITVNGGDYRDPDRGAVDAQRYIADHMAVNKQQVILLDELEKSHPNTLLSYMRMIDEGIVIDSQGIERGINNTIVIATSNLGSKTFNNIYEDMRLENMNVENIEWNDSSRKEFNRLTTKSNQEKWLNNKVSEQRATFLENLRDRYFAEEETVRSALINGDSNLNNGIRPEFLERFKMVVPYFPLTRQVKAKIAKMKLLKFQKEEDQLNYHVAIEANKTHEQWVNIMSTANIKNHQAIVPYKNIDPVSVMIATDIVGADQTKSGARRIDNYIENTVKVKFANLVSERRRYGLDTDGVFLIQTNGHASFEMPTDNKNLRPAVDVKYIEKGGNYDD